MSAFLDAVSEFIDAIRGERAWVEELNALSQKVGGLLGAATPAEIEEALRRYAGLFPKVPLVAVGLVVLNCGSLVERGGDPGIAGPALLDKLPRVLETATDFYHRCRARAEADPDLAAELRARAKEGEDEYDLDSFINEESWDELARRYGPALFQEAPAAVLGHMSEYVFGLGVIAHLSRSKPLRVMARGRPELLAAADAADEVARRRSFLALMLRVLDDEPLVVLHPGQGRGYRVRISGISDNFQLHALLAGHLIGNPAAGLLRGEPIDPRITAFATDAPAEGGADQFTGPFNLWNWTGLLPDGTLPGGTDGSDDWVWNEGTPADIRPFDGVRVVLIGPPPYTRHWRVGRQFPGMVAEFVTERALTPAEVRDWLARIAAAPRPRREEGPA
jgi:hypothetical protein